MKKEHVITEHPWPLLTARVDGMLHEHEVAAKVDPIRNNSSPTKRHKYEFHCNQCTFKCGTKSILSKHTINKHSVTKKILTKSPGPPINSRTAENKLDIENRTKLDVSKTSVAISNSNLAAIQSMIDFEDSSDEDVDDPMEMDENLVAAIQFDGSDIDD